MLRKLTLSGLLAFSLAAAPIAAPNAMARDNGDKFLLGLLAVGIAGAIAHDINTRDRNTTTATKPHAGKSSHKKHHVHAGRHRHGNMFHSHAHGPNHHTGRHNQPTHRQHVRKKPNTCLRQKWTDRGWVKFYSKTCLRNHGY